MHAFSKKVWFSCGFVRLCLQICCRREWALACSMPVKMGQKMCGGMKALLQRDASSTTSNPPGARHHHHHHRCLTSSSTLRHTSYDCDLDKPARLDLLLARPPADKQVYTSLLKWWNSIRYMSFYWELVSELRSDTCRMGMGSRSHSIQVNADAPHHNSISQTDR